jgi:hypothetical protein
LLQGSGVRAERQGESPGVCVWKTCGRFVERLWTHRHEKKFAATLRPKTSAQARGRASFVPGFACFDLFHMRQSCRFRPVCTRLGRASPEIVTVHRYEELIAGRTYQIEVLLVAQSRWRAQIARRPGMPTALMPFYGATPEQAAQELRQWLALIYNSTKQ